MPTFRKAVIAPMRRSHRQYPATSAMPADLFPVVDRDGLTKPALQIIIEDALANGIESIAVIVPPGGAKRLTDYFREWDENTAKSLSGHDWAGIQSEKLKAMAARLTFIETTIDAADPLHSLDATADFLSGDSFVLLPANILLAGGGSISWMERLAPVAESDDVVFAVEAIQVNDVCDSVVMNGSPLNRGPAFERVSQVSQIIDRPTLDQAEKMKSQVLPPGYFFAWRGGPCLLPGSIPAELSAHPDQTFFDTVRRHPIFAAQYDYRSFDLRQPYGLLQAQLTLGLEGVHRGDLCEMLARTLAEKARI